MSDLTTSILVPSFHRPAALGRCLASLADQTHPADEVLVVWQSDDVATRDAAEAARPLFGNRLRVLHCEAAGVVPAENTALAAATGDIILLIDDDAEAPPDWVARHLTHYTDRSVGAVGGPAVNHMPDRTPFPIHDREPIGRFTRYGRAIGNMYDQPAAWRSRPPMDVDHLVGYNLSLRRTAFDRFETALRSYWQLFELEACLQTRSRDFRVRFDFANVVNHYPTNTAYVGGRDGNLEIKIFNPAYNHAFIISRYLRGIWRPIGWLHAMAIGSVGTPGLMAAAVAYKRYGRFRRELRILWRTWAARTQGWRDGRPARCSSILR